MPDHPTTRPALRDITRHPVARAALRLLLTEALRALVTFLLSP
ncbi:hypothetical protein [Streptomyces sp. XY431]|nr:hypothetical protein [Streptomyces sp. XY431]